ncbi:MAG TPA: hypothetical protein VIJ31_12635 [Acidothermaceae bacterium]
MSDERDPLIANALRRLASDAPQPRADRLQAVVAGVHRRRQMRMTTSALTAAAFVVAAAVGVHVWTTTASDSTVGPVPSLPAVSPSPDAAASSALTSLSPAASASASTVPVIAPTPTVKPTATAKGLVATVTTPASVIDGDPARVTMTVTNKGSVTTHGGSFTVVNAYAMAAGNETGFQFIGFTTSCKPVTGGLVCDVGTLKPGQSASFWQAIAATGPADQIVFDVKWTSNTGVSSTFHRVVQQWAGVPSSELPTPPSSGLPSAPVSSGPPVSTSPSTSPTTSPKASSS